jgi:hypothetical protein
MREHPILFSAPMVRAILAGRKSMTRRVVTATNSVVARKWELLDFADAFVDPGGTELFGPGPYLKVKCPSDDTRHRLYPRVQPGDRLWVKETHCFLDRNHRPTTATDVGNALPVYRADHVDPTGDAEPLKWRPSIFMPRWASRMSLDVMTVNVQRLQEIDEADARAEGVVPLQMDGGSYLPRFEGLWDSINAKRPGCAWADNPWVWVLAFKRAEGKP